MPPRARLGSAQGQIETLKEGLWKAKWPYVAATILGVFLLLFGLAVAALEAAEIDKGSDIDTTKVSIGSSRAKSYSIGVGIWSGAVVVVAAISIFVINCTHRVKHWAHVALGLVATAAVFCVTNFSINAKIVRIGVTSGGFNSSDTYTEYRLAAAQIAASSLSFLVCLGFLIMYAVVAGIHVHRAVKRQQGAGFNYQRQLS